jgi:hypothetical protein
MKHPRPSSAQPLENKPRRARGKLFTWGAANADGLALAAVCVILLIACWQPRRVQACGVSGPDGVWSCSLSEHEEEERPRWTVGANASYTATRLRFGQGLQAVNKRSALVATASYAPTAALTLRASAGAGLTGSLRTMDEVHDLDVGPTAAIGAGYRVRAQNPFVLLSAVLSFASARTSQQTYAVRSARYTAFDLRLGAALGWSLWDVLRVYMIARVFGGPIFWRYQGQARTGTDAYHVQLGAGLGWLIAERLNLYLEGIPLGESGLAAGTAVIF